MQSPNECKGFWNFCACEHCRAGDRKLEQDMSDPKKKRQAIDEASVHFAVKRAGLETR